jgi:hypothetical protein
VEDRGELEVLFSRVVKSHVEDCTTFAVHPGTIVVVLTNDHGEDPH